jgi:bacillithiol system protein YtxJ
MQQLLNSDALAAAIASSKEQPILLLKHSATCSISIRAKGQFDQFCAQNPEIPAFYLVVQTHRGLSNQIAENYQIKHESPQLFLVHEEAVLWHTSHGEITEENIQSALQLA